MAACLVAGGSVGDFDWSKINTGIQPGWSADDMYWDLGEVSAPRPNPTWQSPIYNNNGGSNVTILKDSTYRLPSFTATIDASDDRHRQSRAVGPRKL